MAIPDACAHHQWRSAIFVWHVFAFMDLRSWAWACAGSPRERQQTATVRALYHLNELFQGVLLAGCSDGSVRVWRDYTVQGQQRLATAWQVRTSAPFSACSTSVTMQCIMHMVGAIENRLVGQGAHDSQR